MYCASSQLVTCRAASTSPCGRSRRPKPDFLPPILPVVVSFGARRWRASTDLASLFDVAALPADVQQIVLAAQPRFGIDPHDFARKPAAEIRAMDLSAAGIATVAAEQFVAPVGDDDDAAERALAAWADVLRRLLASTSGQEWFAALSSYILKVTKLGRRRLGAVLERHTGAAAMKKFESTYDRITRESRAEGRAEGRVEGRVEGESTGSMTARVETLLRLLTKRFGAMSAAVRRRVRSATKLRLDRWIDRVVDATSVRDVFGA
jgi:hypothetical protein